MAGSLAALTDEQLCVELRQIESLRNQLAAREHAAVAEAEARDLADSLGVRSLPELLAGALRITHAEANARIRAARFLAPRPMMTGELVPPAYPLVAQAMAEGALSPAHARIIIDTIEKLPEAAKADGVEEGLELDLVGWARHFDPTTLGRLAQRVQDTLDPDGLLRDAACRERQRELRLHQRRDGSVHFEGETNIECGQKLLAALTPYLAPRHHNDQTDSSQPASGQADRRTPGEPDGSGRPDPRTPGQRAHDGLLQILGIALRSGQLPRTNGVTTTVILTAPLDALATGNGLIRTGTGALIPAREVGTWFGADTRFFAVLIDKANRPLSYSPQAARLFTETQRLVLAARDGACSKPGCTAPPPQCQAHHVVPWAGGGTTSVDNGTLLCSYDHAHFEDHGWQCEIVDGVAWWTPPAWIDPTRTPRRNTAHNH